MAAYLEDILDMDLNRGSLHRSFLNHIIGKSDIKANRFGVRLFRNGSPVNLQTSTCEGFFLSPAGEHILISGQYAQTNGNTAFVDLPQACYNSEGQFCLVIKVIGDGITGTMRIIDGTIENTFTDGAVAPVGSVPTYQEVLAVYDQMIAAKNGSVRFDISQSLTEDQKAQARLNIGAADSDNLGLYIDAQGYMCQRITSDQ